MNARIIVTLLVVVLLILSGCSSNKSSDQITSYSGNGYTDTANGNVSADTINESAVRKIIKNGTLDLETTDVVKTYSDILTFAKENGGYEFEHTQTSNDSYTSITVQIKIDPEKLDLLMEFAGNSAGIINSTVTSDDITDDYYDAETRLKTKKEVLENYYKYLDEAKTIDETLELQDKIDTLTEDIEAIEGKLKMWNELVNESTLDITISQINDPAKPKKDINWSTMSWSDMGTMIKNGFISVSNVLIAIIQWIIIIVIAISPLLIIAGIVLFATRKKRKELKAKKQALRALFTQSPGNIPPFGNPPVNPNNTQKK
jgi:hypothetical protein